MKMKVENLINKLYSRLFRNEKHVIGLLQSEWTIRVAHGGMECQFLIQILCQLNPGHFWDQLNRVQWCYQINAKIIAHPHRLDEWRIVQGVRSRKWNQIYTDGDGSVFSGYRNELNIIQIH